MIHRKRGRKRLLVTHLCSTLFELRLPLHPFNAQDIHAGTWQLKEFAAHLYTGGRHYHLVHGKLLRRCRDGRFLHCFVRFGNIGLDWQLHG